MDILENLGQVRERIYAAAHRAGRNPGDIKLVAVTKTVPVDAIKEAVACGITCLGENRAQEFLGKYSLLPSNLEWHFIGRLQTNKVKKIVGKVSLIHSLDRWSLARVLHRVSCEAGIVTRVLVQVNVAGEEAKSGLSPAEVKDFVEEAGRLTGLHVCGLMTIAPWCEDPEQTRPVFRQLRKLALRLKLESLSMGMSGDFEVALEEGANIIRLGTALFRQRNLSSPAHDRVCKR